MHETHTAFTSATQLHHKRILHQNWQTSQKIGSSSLESTAALFLLTVSAKYPYSCAPVRMKSLFPFRTAILISWLAFSHASAQPVTSALGTIAAVEAPSAGTDSVVLAVSPATAAWSATADASWLHLSAANQSGMGSALVLFSFDTNAAGTRVGTLTIAGQTLTVTQAGSTYVAAMPLATVVSSGAIDPVGVAVDGVGNVYIADNNNNAIEKWTLASNTFSTLVSSGLAAPFGVAVDGAGNVYIADTYSNAIKEWTITNNSLITLVSSGLHYPAGVAVDGGGNVYIADGNNSAIKEWIAASQTVATLVSSGLDLPDGVALDLAGNVFISDTYHNSIKEWIAESNTVTTVVSSGLNQPNGLAVDGAGNIYIADPYGYVSKWTAASNTLTTLASSGLYYPTGVAVDGSGNVFIADPDRSAIFEVPRAFVDPTPKVEPANAGTDVLPSVLPATESLLAPFAPTSDAPWLTISGISNGLVRFGFTATASNRTAHINLVGKSIPITQIAPVPPPVLFGATWLGNGVFQFAFSNSSVGAPFTVLAATNVSLPLSSWTVVGTATNTAPGRFQFTDSQATNSQRFYKVRSP